MNTDHPTSSSPPPSSPSPPKPFFSSPSFLRPPPTLAAPFYPSPRAPRKTENDIYEPQERATLLDPSDSYSNNWGDEWMDLGGDLDADKDLDDDGLDLEYFETWDREEVAAVELTNEKRCLERWNQTTPSKVLKSVPVNENSLGIGRRTLGAGRPKRKDLLCRTFDEQEGESRSSGVGGGTEGEFASSSVGVGSSGVETKADCKAAARPLTRSRSQRTIFRLGTSTSFKRIRRIPSKLEMRKLHCDLSDGSAKEGALGKDRIKKATPDTDESASKGKGSSTQANIYSAEITVEIKKRDDETAVGKVDAKASIR